MLRLEKNKGSSMIEIVICVALIGICLQYIVMYSSLVNKLIIDQSIRLKNIERVDYLRNHIKYNVSYEKINENINKTLYFIKEDGGEIYEIHNELPDDQPYMSITIEEGENPYVLNIEIIAVEGIVDVRGIVYKGKSRQ